MRGRNSHTVMRMMVAMAISVSFAQAAKAEPAKGIADLGPISWAESALPVQTRRVEPKGAGNDLHPRPLGKVRPEQSPLAVGTRAVGGGGASQTTAVGAMWDNPVVRTGGSLLLVLMLIVGLAAMAKRVAAKNGGLMGAIGAGGRAPEGLLEVLGRYPLARGQTLILLKVDCRVLLLSQTTPRIRGGVGTLSTLCEISRPEDVASILVKAGEQESTTASGRFNALLHAFDRGHADAAGGTHIDHVEVSQRHAEETDEGEGAGERNEQAAMPEIPERSPVLHKFPSIRTHAAHPHPPHPVHPHVDAMTRGGGGDSFATIRERLHALRGEAHR